MEYLMFVATDPEPDRSDAPEEVDIEDWVAEYDTRGIRLRLDEAIEVASRHPMARGGRIELRPIWPIDDDG